MVAIRADGNNEIATGHIMRCMAIASEIKKFDNVVFIVADESPSYLLKANNFKYICLNTAYNDMDSEIPMLITVIHEHAIDKMLVDSYFITNNYCSKLSLFVKLINLDDIGSVRYDVDILINYNIFARDLDYEAQYANTNTTLLLGCVYTPLRDEFQNTAPLFRDTAKKILITTGGSDNFNVAGKLLDTIIKQNLFLEMEIHVVAGSMNQNTGYLKALSAVNDNIFIHQNVSDMARLMVSCDIGVTAGGSTLYELCACGVPSVCFSMADNQLKAVEQFAKDELMLYAGDFRDNEAVCLTRLTDYLVLLVNDCKKRRELFEKITLLTDGGGAAKIANKIRYL